MTEIIIPSRIYLQFGDLEMNDSVVVRLNQIAVATWCTDKINDTDVEYIRADTRATSAAAPSGESIYDEAIRIAHDSDSKTELLKRLENAKAKSLAAAPQPSQSLEQLAREITQLL